VTPQTRQNIIISTLPTKGRSTNQLMLEEMVNFLKKFVRAGDSNQGS
jgi:hypothetical protein